MPPVTKETVEAGSSAQSSAPQQSNLQSTTSSGHSRADVVSLEVPVKVHGSRYVSADGQPAQTERFEEQTATMIVFPEGGVLRMTASVNAGQMLVLTNLKSRQDAICRVVKVRNFPSVRYVEVEFTRPQAGYWGVYFTPQGEAGGPGTPATQAAPPATAKVTFLPTQKTAAPSLPQHAPAARPAETKSDSKREVEAAKPPAAAPRVSVARPASTFVSLGTKEEIQPAAASTDEASLHRIARELAPKTLSTEKKEVGSVEPAGPTAHGGRADLTLPEEDLDAALASAKPAADDAGEFGEFFGQQRRFGSLAEQSGPPERHQSWTLVAAAIAALFLVVAGGAWYFHARGASNAGVTGNPAVSAPATSPARQANASATGQPAATSASEASPGVRNTIAASGSAATRREPLVAVPARSTALSEKAASNVAKPQPEVGLQNATIPSQPATAQRTSPTAQTAPSVLTASGLKAHPLSSQRSAGSLDEAPAINATADPSQVVAIPGSSKLDLAPPSPERPVRVGGDVKQPRLISSVMPIYPWAAKAGHVEGDVVVDTRISKNGSVENMKVTDGPMMLRQAALDALRKWRYEPSELDGKPVEVEMLITVRFRL
jgi:TonB family protein